VQLHDFAIRQMPLDICNGISLHVSFKHLGYLSMGRIESPFLKWGRITKKFEKPWYRLTFRD